MHLLNLTIFVVLVTLLLSCASRVDNERCFIPVYSALSTCISFLMRWMQIGGGGGALPFSLLIKWRSCSPWTVLIIKYPSSCRDWLHLLMMNISMLPVGRRYLPLLLSWPFCFRRIGHRFSGNFFFKSFSLDPKNALKADPTTVSVPFSGLFIWGCRENWCIQFCGFYFL